MNILDENRTYYHCFSMPLMGYLRYRGIRYLTCKQHYNGKWFYIFEQTPELSEALTDWQNRKIKT